MEFLTVIFQLCGPHERLSDQFLISILLPQVLHNMALAQAQLGDWEKAQENLVKALDYKTEAKLNIIDRALQSTLVSQNVITII